MTLDRGDWAEIGAKQRQALGSPVRLRILELFARDRRRPVTAETFHRTLIEADEFRHLKIKQVGYHVACLRDADLLPPRSRR